MKQAIRITRWHALGLCLGLCLGLGVGVNMSGAETPRHLELTLQTRDRETGEIRRTTEKVDPARVGIVAVDIWNYHWCKTSAARAGSFVPRINHALAVARSLGIQVFHCPSDAVESWVGTPQLESVLMVEPEEPPRKEEIDCPAPADGGGCTCGKERCMVNYGWDGLHPDLDIAEGDLLPNDVGRLYALCRQKGITHLIYVGFHTQVCLLGKSIGVNLAPANAVNIGSRRELFVDDYLIDSLSGAATRHLFEMEPATTDRDDVAMIWNDDWEGSWTRYSTYIDDNGRIKAWYHACHTDGNRNNRTCYAVSEDGQRFTKPELGLYEWKGSRANNALFDQHTFKNAEGRWVDQSHNFAPFLDRNPAAAPDAKYKGFGGQGEGLGPDTGLYAFQSADGIHWKLASDSPIVSNRYRLDSKNQGFWCAVREQYVLYFRNLRNNEGQEGIGAPGWRRDIMVSFSDDFTGWSEPRWLVYYRNDGRPGMELEHLYTNEIQPYPRAPHIYLGFPARLVAGSRTEPMFMASRDGVHFSRWMDRPVIPPTAPADRDKVRSNHVWQEMVEIPGEPDSYSMYASENLGISGHHADGSFPRLRRFRIRKDGLVSVRAEAGRGELLTKPLTFAGNALEVNYHAELGENGFVKVEILDENGQAVPGFTAEDCDPLTGNAIDARVTWNGNSDVGSLAGRTIHLRFVLDRADLFSLKFGEST